MSGAWACLGLALSSGCGARPATDVHATFRAIQVDEARIARASLALEAEDEPERSIALASEICAAADDLADRASRLEDRDAARRSAEARGRCERARLRVERP